MDTLTFITKIIEQLSWPIAAVMISIILKGPIENLLSRLNKAKHKDTEFEFNPDIQRSSTNIVSTSNVADVIPQDQLGLIGEAEQRIYESLENLSIKTDSEKVKVLAKHHANLQIRSTFLAIYNLIFGSQITLLQTLNVQNTSVEREFLLSFYEAAKQEFPDVYDTYSFENYINFLKSVGLINTEKSKYFITVLGRGFLTYLAETGLNTKRAY